MTKNELIRVPLKKEIIYYYNPTCTHFGGNGYRKTVLFVTMTDSDKESMMKTHNLVLAGCLVGGLAGCANMSSGEQRTLSGAGIGAAAGALIGE